MVNWFSLDDWVYVLAANFEVNLNQPLHKFNGHRYFLFHLQVHFSFILYHLKTNILKCVHFDSDHVSQATAEENKKLRTFNYRHRCETLFVRKILMMFIWSKCASAFDLSIYMCFDSIESNTKMVVW